MKLEDHAWWVIPIGVTVMVCSILITVSMNYRINELKRELEVAKAWDIARSQHVEILQRAVERAYPNEPSTGTANLPRQRSELELQQAQTRLSGAVVEYKAAAQAAAAALEDVNRAERALKGVDACVHITKNPECISR